MGYASIPNLYKNQEILIFKRCYALEKIHGCVHGGTLVLLPDGSQKPIRDLKDGDIIMSLNLSSGEFEKDTVEAMFCRPSNSTLKWFKLTTDGWIKAEDLTEDHILR
jgi:hypothetical protein